MYTILYNHYYLRLLVGYGLLEFNGGNFSAISENVIKG